MISPIDKSEQNIKFWAWGTWFFIIVLLLAFGLTISIEKELSARRAVVVWLDMFCILISIMSYRSLLRNAGRSQESRIYMMFHLVAAAYLFFDAFHHIAEGDAGLWLPHVIAIVLYLICPVILTLLFWRYIGFFTKGKDPLFKPGDYAIKILGGLEIIMAVASAFTGSYFCISRDTGIYERGPLYVGTTIIPLLMMLICVIRILHRNMQKGDRRSLLIYPLAPYVALLFQTIHRDFGLLSVGTFLGIAYMYTNLYMRKEEEAAEFARNFSESQLRTLQMQINPHFLYNTLASMASMCDTDPKSAQEMIYLLSDYMRDNYTDIEKPATVTLEEELVQLEHYTAIQSMRFPNITFRQDIRASDFLVPSMCLQPLVENSIKHGIRRRKNTEGVITVVSRETKDFWIVRVEDNGVGFDATKVSEDPHGHVGQRNVEERLAMLTNGTLTMTGEPGVGTVAEIKIPKE